MIFSNDSIRRVMLVLSNGGEHDNQYNDSKILLADVKEKSMKPRDYDRYERNETDGMEFYGYDRDDGKTDWYDESGHLDCVTETPDEEDDW